MTVKMIEPIASKVLIGSLTNRETKRETSLKMEENALPSEPKKIAPPSYNE